MDDQHIGRAHNPDSPCIGHNLDQTSLGDTHIHQEPDNFHECNSRRKWLQNMEFLSLNHYSKIETYVYDKTFLSILLHKCIAKGFRKIHFDNQVRSRICHKGLQTIPPHIHIYLVQCNFHFGKMSH